MIVVRLFPTALRSFSLVSPFTPSCLLDLKVSTRKNNNPRKMPSHVGTLAELQKVFSQNPGKLVVLDCFAEWCGPCKMIAPQFAALEAETPEAVFLKVDVDEAEDIADTYQVQSLPTFKFFKNGTIVAEFSGANIDTLKKMVAQHK